MPSPSRSSPTELMRAANAGNPERVADLLDNGADPFETDEDGWTALTWALSRRGRLCQLNVTANLVERERTSWREGEIYSTRSQLGSGEERLLYHFCIVKLHPNSN